MPLPELPDAGVPATGPSPVEALPAPRMEAMGAAFQNGLGRTLGISLEGTAIGKLRGGAWVPFDDAKAEMESEGYDAHVLPKNGLTRGELDTIVSLQSKLKQNDAIVSQSHLSDFTAGAMSFGGGSLDPMFIGAGPVLGRLGLAAKGMSLPGRIAAGGTEGAVIGGVYDVGLQHFGNSPGDRDIGTDQIVKDAAFMALGGAVLHGAFGPRKAPLSQRMQVLDTHKAFLQDNFPGIAITSTVRDLATNKRVGGVINSMHLSGEATDFVLPRGVTAAEAKAAIKAKGLPITEWLVEKKGDPHSTGDHIHWGWGEKGRGHFGQAEPAARTPVVHPTEDMAAQALSAASVDAKPVVPDVPLRSFAEAKEADMAASEGIRATDVEGRAKHPSVEPGSIFAQAAEQARSDAGERPAKQDLTSFGEPVERAISAETAELKSHADAAVAEAKARPAPEGAEQHPVDVHLEEAEESLHNQGYSGDMVKAISAAVRCALVQGVD